MTDSPDLSLERYQKTWAGYDRSDRRRVMRAVNRAQPLEDPAEAALAVAFARRQRRMWTRYAWIYPLIPAALAARQGWAVIFVNLLVGVFLVALFSAFFTWRAKRAEQLNLAVIEESQRRKRSGSPKTRGAGASKSQAAGGSKSRKRRGRRP